jgi:hypothetical protein
MNFYKKRLSKQLFNDTMVGKLIANNLGPCEPMAMK